MSQKSMYFGYLGDRNPGDIETLWNVFEKAIELQTSCICRKSVYGSDTKVDRRE
jgi:hypothetical protein